MNPRVWCALGSVALLLPVAVASVTIEPDDYAHGTVLNTVRPEVSLSTADTNNAIYTLFDVTAANDQWAPTGDRVFAHVNIPFFNHIRRLRMDFHAPVYAIQIDFGGGDFFNPEIGRVQAFNAAGALVAEVVSSPLLRDVHETLRLERPEGDIAYAVGFIADGEGSFGRWDRLVLETAPPSCDGDLDGSGAVGLQDLAILLAHFGQPSDAGRGDGDSDADGDVDLQDLANLLGRFGSTC